MILVIDDQDIIRKVLTMMLKRLGHEVIALESGEEGIAAYKQHAADVKLAIIDISMPDMDGHECLEHLVTINPNVKAAFSSGFSMGMKAYDTNPNVVGFLQKPFGLEEVSALISQVL